MADGNSCFRIGKTSNIDSWNVVTRSRIAYERMVKNKVCKMERKDRTKKCVVRKIVTKSYFLVASWKSNKSLVLIVFAVMQSNRE